ncbi:MAG: tetratricopeptide repeat protein, partial [Abditibacteriales bacterium]|nr:tetratricopeptide repeat protein [Abditibacteriales bacterium]MDW8367311.1 tetratricopeptide repeat protein [Abditibacteriales bacterium]
MLRVTSLFITLIMLTFARPAFAQKPPLTPLAVGREALIERKYEEAVRALTAAASQGGQHADEAQLLLGHAYYYAKKYQEAIAAYDKLLRDFPRSAWRKKALFKKADCYLALKQYDKAAEIYEPEMAYIVSDERKEQVADTYLKYANQYFEPPKDPKKETPAPNLAKAKSLFQKALDIGLTPKRREEVLFRIAMCDFKTGNFSSAGASFSQLLREYPKGAHVEPAKYHLGLAHLRAGNDRAARKVFKDFLSDYPKSALRGDVSYALAETFHVPSPRDDKELELGVKALRSFVAEFPNHEKARQAAYFIGLSYFNQQRYEDAIKEFQSFIKNHAITSPNPSSPRRGTASAPPLDKEGMEEVALAKNNLGLAFLRLKKYSDAIAAWEAFLREHPVHRLWNSVQRQVIDAQYAIGDEAYKAKKYDEARQVWAAFQEKYPLDVRNADIMFRLGMMLHEEKKYDAAMEQWQKVASKYADTESASRAQFMIAMTLEKQDKFEEAMEAFRKVTGNWQQEAQRRLQALRQRKLVVYTERTFTTADTPALKLITRNIKRLEFRAYKVDMGDYFGKLHTMRGVERLDLALIEPDQRWELNLPNYQDFKELETDAPLPFKDPGVYAVICQAPLDPEEQQRYRDAGQEPPVLEATNIVLISDLGIITKITHNDVFVFAENLRDRKPWRDATISISDGRRVIVAGKTDGDGVFHYQFPKTQSPEPKTNEWRVLAVAHGHYASTEGNLQNVAVVAGLQPTAFLYTDRPLYRPGQPVHLRGIVRRVENGVYVFKKGDEFTLTIHDPHGGVIHTRQVQLNDFGTFSASLVLHDEAPLGRYRMLLTQKKAVTPEQATAFWAEGYFQVATYQLEKVRLTIDLPKSVYLRGEDIRGKVIAKYYYGEPLAKRKVKFGWNNEVGEERETNEKGEFEFTIPTRQFEEEEVVNLWARLEEEGAATQTAAYVATVGVRAHLTMVRDLHLVGERFDVSIEAKDLADKPFAGAFTLKVLKHEKDEAGRLGEREVQSLPVKTDKEGKAKVSLSLAAAGDYTLRLLGQDANGNPLTSETFTKVVGDEDKVR